MKTAKLIKQLMKIIGFAIIALIIFILSPWGKCIDIMSGKVPPEAMDKLVRSEISARVANHQSIDGIPISETYDIIFKDDLAGEYEVGVRFNKSDCISIRMRGLWPTCPDFNVTDQEIKDNLNLVQIKAWDYGGSYGCSKKSQHNKNLQQSE